MMCQVICLHHTYISEPKIEEMLNIAFKLVVIL
jgi:hypothetical protein